MWLAGLDPGGKDRFGWCLAEGGEDWPVFVRRTGVASNATEAVNSIVDALPRGAELVAAGIDSPLYWNSSSRAVDVHVRDRIHELGARSSGGTVQHVNSLRGACLVQGILVANLLRQRFSDIRLTEAHPKALLWLLGIANREVPVESISLQEMGSYISTVALDISEHERDAALAAVGAFAMHGGFPAWRDIAEKVDIEFAPAGSIEYWMPQS